MVHICNTIYVTFSKKQAFLMRNGYFGILRSIAIVIGIGFAFNMLAGLILVLFNGTDIKEASPSVMIMANSFAQIVMMLGVPILIVRYSGHNFFESFRLEGMSETRLPVHLIGIPIIAVGQFAGQGFVSLWMITLRNFPTLNSTLESFQKMMDDMMSGLTTPHSPMELTLLLFGVAIVPAFAEESFFRGFIQTNIERSGKERSRPVVAIIITSVLFAALHISPLEFPGLLTIGLLLGWLAYRTCDLRVSVLAHAFNNGAIVIIAYLMKDNPDLVQSLSETKAQPLGDTLALLGVSLPILFGLLYVFQKMTNPLQSRHHADLVIEYYNFTEPQTEESFTPYE